MPKSEAVIVLGASVYSDGNLSDILQERADEAIDIYIAQKASKILVSGFVDSYYNEPVAIKNYLLENNIKEEDILIDQKGISTFDSIVNAKNDFGLKSLIIPTQIYHLPRSIYIAKNIGLPVSGIALNDDYFLEIKKFRARELIAKMKSFYSISYIPQ